MRAERPSDVPAVRAVPCAAFPTDAEARLVDALRAAGQALVSLVAAQQETVLGHVLFSPVEGAAPGGAGLAPLAVLPRFRGQGIGQALVIAGLEACARAGLRYVVVLGEPAYYRRFGFRRASEFGLASEYGADEAFMALELASGALAAARGVVKYRPEFSIAD